MKSRTDDRGSKRHSRLIGTTSIVAATASVGLWSSCALAASADEALRSPAMASKLAEYRQACSPETIDAVPKSVVLAPGATAVLVTFTSSKRLCFGQPGQNDYLLTHGAAGWRIALAAEPGSIGVGQPDAKGHAPVILHGLGMCQIAYRWTGSRYRPTASKDCHGLSGAPTLLDVRARGSRTDRLSCPGLALSARRTAGSSPG